MGWRSLQQVRAIVMTLLLLLPLRSNRIKLGERTHGQTRTANINNNLLGSRDWKQSATSGEPIDRSPLHQLYTAVASVSPTGSKPRRSTT